MVKIFAHLLGISLTFFLVACSGGDSDSKTKAAPKAQTQPPVSPLSDSSPTVTYVMNDDFRNEALKAVAVSPVAMQRLKEIIKNEARFLPADRLIVPDPDLKKTDEKRAKTDLARLSEKGKALLENIRTSCTIVNPKNELSTGEYRPGSTTKRTYGQLVTGAGCPFFISNSVLHSTSYSQTGPVGRAGSSRYEKDSLRIIMDPEQRLATSIESVFESIVTNGEFQNRGEKIEDENSKYVTNVTSTMDLNDRQRIVTRYREISILVSGKERFQMLIETKVGSETVVVYRAFDGDKEELLLNGKPVTLEQIREELGIF